MGEGMLVLKRNGGVWRLSLRKARSKTKHKMRTHNSTNLFSLIYSFQIFSSAISTAATKGSCAISSHLSILILLYDQIKQRQSPVFSLK